MPNEYLPPLPGSDIASLDRNRRDPHYGITPREFWGENTVVREELKPFENCDHYFEYKKEGVLCKKCHMGYVGLLEIRNGKLFHKGEALGL